MLLQVTGDMRGKLPYEMTGGEFHTLAISDDNEVFSWGAGGADALYVSAVRMLMNHHRVRR